MKMKITLAVAFIALVVVISGCSGINTGSGNRKYYQGYDSLDIRFMDESPPMRFYYDSASQDNEIPIILEVKNKGASDAFGAIYIHGFDPHFTQIAGGLTPGGSNIRLEGGPGNFGFSVNGIYTGNNPNGGGRGAYSFGTRTTTNARTGATTTTAGLGGSFVAPDGTRYGGRVFTRDGQIQSFSISIGSGYNRIGSALAYPTLRGLTDYTGWNAIIALEGQTPDNPSGGLEVYDFPAYIYGLPESLEEFRQPIMATACYDYATHATAMICVDPNPNNNVKKVCRPQSVGMGSGQGAPVAITRVDQQSSKLKTIFTIHVQHKRQNALDDVFDYDKLYKCDPNAATGEVLKTTDKNVVYIGYITLSGIPLYCTPDYRIRLDESGSGEINCVAEFGAETPQSAYEAPLEIELWYGYSKNIYRNVIIKQI